MPNIKSAKKRAKTSEEARQRNKAVKSRVKTARGKFMKTAAEGGLEASTEAYKTYCSTLDKAAKKGVIKRNTAIRRKRRAAARVKSAD